MTRRWGTGMVAWGALWASACAVGAAGSSSDGAGENDGGQPAPEDGGGVDGSSGDAGGCGQGTWNHDDDPATACVAWSECGAGHYVRAPGSSVNDRQCAPCASGTFSTAANAPECAAWTPCEEGSREASPGSATEDRVCQVIDACAEADPDTDANPCNDEGDASAACVDRGAEGYECTCSEGWASDGERCLPSTCSALLDANPAAVDGEYLLNPSTDSQTFSPMTAYCDMTTDGGGWTLVLSYTHAAGTNPSPQARTVSLPTLGAAVLGTDESGTDGWGHAANSLFAALGGNELRFEARTSGHGRVLDFASAEPGCIAYFASGLGNCRGLGASNRELGAHDAYLPDALDGGWEDQGDLAMTAFPFFRGGTYHWGIGALGRWEVDDYPNDASRSTVHRIWTRTLPVFESCAEALASSHPSPEGGYLLDLDGEGSNLPRQLVCDEDGWIALSGVEDFSRGTATGWSSDSVDTDSACHGVFGNTLGGYGRFGSGASVQKTYDFTGVEHSEVQVQLDFISIDSWDSGEVGRVSVDGAVVFEQQLNGGQSNECGGEWYERGAVPVSYTGSHTADTVTVSVTSTLDSGPTDESWAIDNVIVRVR